METKFRKIFQKYHTFTELILLLALVPFVFVLALGGNVKGEQKIVAGVQSSLVVEYDDEIYEFKTYKTTINDALTEQSIETYEQDEFSLSRNTRLYGQDIRLYIEKSLPIIIYDNTEKIWGRTTKSVPEEILKQNKIEYWPEDVLESELITDPVSEGGVGQLVRITRAPVFKVYVDDEIMEIRSWALDVAGVLEGEVSLGEKDIIKPSLDSFAEPGEIHITRINVIDTEITASIPYKTVSNYDYYTPEGTSSVITAGVNGTKKQKVRIRYENGEEVSRIVISETVTKAAKSQVVKKGLMPSSHRDFNRIYWNYMVSAGTKYGISPSKMFTVAACESHVNPNSANYTHGYYGMYQYSLGLWTTTSAAAGYPGAHWSNGKAQIYATAYLVNKENNWGRWPYCGRL